MSTRAQRVILAKRPIGAPDSETFQIVDLDLPAPAAGEFIVEIELVSLAPAMRGWLDDKPSYVAPLALGEAMRGRALGVVRSSQNPDFQPGDVVTGPFGASTMALSDGLDVVEVDLGLAPAETWLGALDGTGLTAYFGLLEVGKMVAGDTVLVSGAAGAVGSVVGQIAKRHGCRVIGIAGGTKKCAWLEDELGFDVAIDYKSEAVSARLDVLVPDGVDVYFDNVGGTILEDALDHLAHGARVVICGAISGYNDPGPRKGPSNYLSLLVHSATMAGFVLTDFKDRYDEGRRVLGEWVRDGQLVAREHVVHGRLDDFGSTFGMLFEGSNTGKLVLKIS